MQKLKCKIRGIHPLLMHNGRLADPSDPASIELARYTKIKNKTDEVRLHLARAEWFGGLYVTKQGEVYMPSSNIESCIVDGGKQYRRGMGPQLKSVFCDRTLGYPIRGDHEGLTPDEMFEMGDFVHRCMVRQDSKRVVRVRPIFPKWEIEFALNFDSALIELDTMVEVVRAAGMRGLGDWRPKFGTFELISATA